MKLKPDSLKFSMHMLYLRLTSSTEPVQLLPRTRLREYLLVHLYSSVCGRAFVLEMLLLSYSAIGRKWNKRCVISSLRCSGGAIADYIASLAGSLSQI